MSLCKVLFFSNDTGRLFDSLFIFIHLFSKIFDRLSYFSDSTVLVFTFSTTKSDS